jgi:O-acetyl-ADP-ribose deacetylase
LREAHRAGLVTSFDWPTWMTGRGRELTGDPEAIGGATLEECRRLLVAHLRRDRFVHGHLKAMIDGGEIPTILRRAAELTASRNAGTPERSAG